MKPKVAIISFFSLLGIGGLIYFIPNSSIVPVATVNYRPISQSDLKAISGAASTYYENALKTYGGDDKSLKKEENKEEIRRASLQQLIEDQLIQGELEKRLGNDLNSVVKNKIGDKTRNAEFEKGVTTLYGINFADYQRLFLVPQAKREILEGRLFIDKKDLQSWLEDAKKDAKIIFFTTEFTWNNNVEINNQ